MQRRDDIGRLCQVLVTAVAGLHPAIWWINRQLHIEREAACDDWTINITGAPKGYAACLTKLASTGNGGVLVPAAFSSFTLKTRVMRLLDRDRNRSTRFTVASLAVAPLLAAIAVAAASVEFVVSRPAVLAHFDRVVHAAQAPTPAPREQQNAGERSTSETSRTGARRFEPSRVRLESEPLSPTTSVTAPTASDRAAERTAPIHVEMTLASLPGASEPAPPSIEIPSTASSTNGVKTATPWGVAADAGVALGDAGATTGTAIARGSKKGAVATAGFFTRMGKSIGRSF